jgi:hypothetical protein
MESVKEIQAHRQVSPAAGTLSSKKQELTLSTIPAKAGIQCFRIDVERLDRGFHRCDDFLRDHHI